MMTTIVHPDFGEVKYSAVYFRLDEPILFTCYFSESDEKYVGIMVEDFEHNSKRVQSFYFAGVADNELRMLESKPGKLKELFAHRKVWWFNRHSDGREYWERQNGVLDYYNFTERASLK